MLKSQDDIGRTNWVSSIRIFLFSYLWLSVWLSQDVGNDAHFIKELKQRIKDCYQQILGTMR